MGLVKNYIKAARLKTLPLAIASPLVGISLAIFDGSNHFNWLSAGLCILVAILLQVLSNFANDLGDFQKGTDQKAGRTDRMLSSGGITEQSMKWVIAYLALFTLISGVALISISVRTTGQYIYFLGMGLTAITAAITYTVGKKAYGYYGLGDVFVFLFFGLMAVVTTFFILTQTISSIAWIAGASMGFFATMVLHINNTRDLKSDQENNKNTIAVKLGFQGSRIYHICLAGLASLGLLRILVKYNTPFVAIGLFLLLILLHQFLNLEEEDKEGYNQQLKFTSLTAAFIALSLFLHAVFQYL